MAEPITPEAYLALAATVHKAVNGYRDKRAPSSDEQSDGITTTGAAADGSKPTPVLLPTDDLLSYAGLKVGNDGYVQFVVESPALPRNWSGRRKAFDFGVVLFAEFLMSAVGAAGTEAEAGGGGGVLGRWSREVGLVWFMTMYLLGQALGAWLLAPYSDMFGRRTLYVGSAFLYSVFCLPVAATSNTIAGVFVGRFVTGVVAAVPAVITRRCIDDLFRGGESRMWAFSAWALVTNLGVALGPVYAGYVTASMNWRWPFYLASIIVAVAGTLMYFVRESHAPILLERTVAAIRSHRPDLTLRTAPTAPRPSIFRPLILFFTNPTVFFASLAYAFSTALLYLFAVAFPLIYARYAWSERKTTLIFLFIALGFFFSALTRFYDRHAIRKSRLTNRPLPAEEPLLGLVIGAPALAVGLWWFAWTISGSRVQTLPWPASALSLVLVGYGINEYSTTLPRYILQPYSRNSNVQSNDDASSAFVALLIPRALLSATFPLFTEPMLRNLGNNVAGSVLAAVATAFCLLTFIVVRFGNGSRRKTSVGAVVDGGSSADDESGGGNATKVVVVVEEKETEKDVKPKVKAKKTVRFWDDEENGLEDTKSGSSEEVGSSGSFSSAETVVERTTMTTTDHVVLSSTDGDVSADDDDNAAAKSVEAPASEHVHASVAGEGDGRVTDTVAASTDGSTADGINNADDSPVPSPKRKDPKRKQEKRVSSRIHDTNDGYTSFSGLGLGMGTALDVERLVGFPYL